MHINIKNNVNVFFESSRIFSMQVPTSFIGCQAHTSLHLIVQTSLSRVAMEFSSGVNYITTYAVYWIFKALSRHKSFSCKRRYGKYCLFYIVQACKFVTARFCYRANWTRVGTRITVLIQTSVCYTRSFTQLTKPISAGVSIRCHSI